MPSQVLNFEATTSAQTETCIPYMYMIYYTYTLSIVSLSLGIVLDIRKTSAAFLGLRAADVSSPGAGIPMAGLQLLSKRGNQIIFNHGM